MRPIPSGISPLDDLRAYRFRYTLMGTIIGAATLVLVGAMSVPFFFESPSMWYKFGFDKALLRTGKMLGLVVATLLFFQLIPAAEGDMFYLINEFFTLALLNDPKRIIFNGHL